MDITRAKIRDLRKALDSKQISAAELCGEYFRNIEAGDGKVQSFITVTKERRSRWLKTHRSALIPAM